jgi:hypothetical protein
MKAGGLLVAVIGLMTVTSVQAIEAKYAGQLERSG